MSSAANAFVEFSRAAEGRSQLYAQITAGVAADPQILSFVDQLPPTKRQPNLLLAAVKYLHGVARDFAHFRDLLLQDAEAIRAVIATRYTQTNEPARCATLMPLFARLPQPLALLEVGASAGLCLFPDRYGYDYDGIHLAAPSAQAPVFRCRAGAGTPVPQSPVLVAWRVGLDLHPLDCRDPEDVGWLKALVWPGERNREAQLEQALAIARAEPPRILEGNLLTDLPALASQAPRDATLVVFHSAVLNYVHDPAQRTAFAAGVRAMGAEWIAQEDPDVFAPDNRRTWPSGSFFMVTHNGVALASADSHGAWIDWLA